MPAKGQTTTELSDLEREVSRLCLEERLTSKEIGQRLGVSGTAVAKARQRARAKGAQLVQHSRRAPSKELTPRQLQAVALFVSGQTRLAAYRAVCENPNASSGDAARFFNDPRVAAEIAAQQQLVRERTAYTAELALLELDEGLRFARETENSTAYARVLELRLRLAGLLIDRQHVVVEQPDLVRAMQIAERRLERAGLQREPIDVTDVAEVRPAIPSVLS